MKRVHSSRWAAASLGLLLLVGRGAAQQVGKPIAATPTSAQPGQYAQPSQSAQSAAQTPALQIETIGLATVAVGEPLRYEIVVRNQGTTPAAQVRVEDRLSTDAMLLGAEPQPEIHEDRLSWELGTVEPGTERRLRIALQMNRAADLTTHATVICAASSSLTTRFAPVKPATRPKVDAPAKLEVRGTVATEGVVAGDPALVQYRITNGSPAPISGVVFQNRLPAGLRHPKGEVIEADVGVLAPGETRTLTLRVLALQAGKQVLEGRVDSREGLRAEARVAVDVRDPGEAARNIGVQRASATAPAATLLVEVTDADDPIEVGSETAYRIRIRNPGAAPVFGVRLMTTIPSGMALEGAAGPTAHSQRGQHVLFQPLNQLGAGGEVCYLVRVRGKQAGDWRFKAHVTTDSGSKVIQEEQSTRVYGK